MNQPFFSVIIPTYNRADRLIIALDSLVAQTYKKFEVLVCDDGSTDNTSKVSEDYKQILDLTHIWEENWGGPARPRNNGIKASKGDWICFLDSDDWWYPDKLAKCLSFVNEYDVVYHDLQAFDNDGKLNQVIKGRKIEKDVFDDLVINRNAIPNSSVIVKKEYIYKVGFISEDKELVAIEDYDLWIKIARLTNKFYYLPLELGAYYISGVNISNDFEKRNFRETYIFNQYKDLLTSHNLKIGLINLNFSIAVNYILGNSNKYRKHLFFVLVHGSLRKKIKALFFLVFGKFYIKHYLKLVF